MRLRYSEFVEQGEGLALGEQIHINHDSCEAGVDTKRRLYIKRETNGDLLAYCHHCGKSGYHREAYARISASKKKSVYSGRKPVSSVPRDTETDIRNFPGPAAGWLMQYGITDKEITDRGIGYSPKWKRVVIPIEYGGKFRGFQLRKIDQNDPINMKYLTYGEKGMFWHGFQGKSGNPDTLIVVEDVVSGVRCSRFYPTIALLSSHMSDHALAWIATQTCADKFLIFLDNDNYQVKKSQLDIKNRLDMLGRSVIIKVDRDPKEHSHLELEEVLDNAHSNLQ